MPNQSLIGLSIRELFAKLSSLIKSFSKDLGDVIDKRNAEAPNEEIKELIESIKTKAPTSEREKQENAEIIKLLEMLLVDKKLFSVIKLETSDWTSLLDAIDYRIKIGKGLFDKEEQMEIEKISALAKEMRSIIMEKDGNIS